MEVDFGGVEGVVEPTAELVVTGTGVWLAKVVGDLGGEIGVVEESKGGGVGGGDRLRDGGEDGGEGLDGGLCLGERIRP